MLKKNKNSENEYEVSFYEWSDDSNEFEEKTSFSEHLHDFFDSFLDACLIISLLFLPVSFFIVFLLKFIELLF